MPYNLGALLKPGGHAREFMRQAPGGGAWVDDFCDEILTSITTRRRVQDFVERFGAAKANASLLPDGRVQLNIKWTTASGWRCYTGATVDDAIDQFWDDETRVLQPPQ